MQISMPASFDFEGSIKGKIYRETPLWQLGLFTVWFFVLLIPLERFTLIRYACLAAILLLFARYFERTIPLLMRAWPLLPFPVIGLLSITWSTYPSHGFNEAVLLLLTPFILATLAVQLRPHEFFRLIAIAGLMMISYFIAFSIPMTGPGSIMHKQLLAYHFLLISVAGLVTALNTRELLVFRAAGLLLCPIAFMLQMGAESVTSMVLGVLVLGGLVGYKFVWNPISQVEHLRSMLVLIVLIAVIAALLVFVSMPQNMLVDDLLNSVGKDRTLTGRTLFWDAAERVSDEKPFLGHGLGGFWHPDVGTAQTIAELNFSAPGTKVSFHSVFWETKVHLGWVGVVTIFLGLGWAFFRSLLNWFRDTSFINTGLLAFLIITSATIFTESYLAAPLNVIVLTFYFGALSSFDPGARRVALKAKTD